jgi:hypothetical protein
MDWRKIQEGKNTRWSLKHLVCTEQQYKELLVLREYLIKLTPSNAEPFLELDEVCIKLGLPAVEKFILYNTYSDQCSTKPLCSMLRVLDVSPRLIWVEHYICLYEQFYFTSKP